MFEKIKLQRKIAAFRRGNVEYSIGGNVVKAIAGKHSATLATKLVQFDGRLQLAFSGDILASDPESLARVMKALWNCELPDFPEIAELRAQLNKSENQILYFRDMAGLVAGMPNEVTVTVKASYMIDNI